MIDKQKLEELIKQGATIYSCYSSEFYSDKIIDLSKKHFYIEDDMLFSGNTCWAGNDEHWDFEDLFETEEEAQEYFEFGNVTRTEKLELPCWKEMKERFDNKQIDEKYFYYAKHFFSPNTTNAEDTYSIYLLINGYIVIDDDKKTKTIFDKVLTKENYNEARRLCVKLFKGE